MIKKTLSKTTYKRIDSQIRGFNQRYERTLRKHIQDPDHSDYELMGVLNANHDRIVEYNALKSSNPPQIIFEMHVYARMSGAICAELMRRHPTLSAEEILTWLSLVE